MDKQTALITGASGGIGYELAQQFARHGFDLVLVARSVDTLKEIAVDFQTQHRITVHIAPFNLAQPDAPGELFHHLERNGIVVDVLVNNAGFGIHGLFHENDLPETMELVQVNVAAVTQLTGLFLKGIVQRNRGGILNVASTSAFQPGPYMAAYHASKAYILSLTEGIASELAGTNVKISVLCPGPTDTGFQERARNTGSILGNRTLLMMPAEKVARIAYEEFMDGKRIILPGLLNKLGAISAPRAPRSWVLPIVKYLHHK
jgi:short-subunit dehydrogenase